MQVHAQPVRGGGERAANLSTASSRYCRRLNYLQILQFLRLTDRCRQRVLRPSSYQAVIALSSGLEPPGPHRFISDERSGCYSHSRLFPALLPLSGSEGEEETCPLEGGEASSGL